MLEELAKAYTDLVKQGFTIFPSGSDYYIVDHVCEVLDGEQVTYERTTTPTGGYIIIIQGYEESAHAAINAASAPPVKLSEMKTIIRRMFKNDVGGFHTRNKALAYRIYNYYNGMKCTVTIKENRHGRYLVRHYY